MHNATFGPAHWTPATRNGEPVPDVWTKELLRRDHGDSFTLLRLGFGAKFELSGSANDRLLVLDGEFTAADREQTYRRGAYCAGGADVLSGHAGCLALVLTGDRLGAPAADVFSPDGWLESGPGQWFRLLLDVTFDEHFDERVIGLSYFEPCSTAPRHPHRTAHRILFLDGEADDELVFPDGTRRTAHRMRGDFVDYPYPIQHQTFSGTGCTILFAHEPISTT
ncbi:hypothetical protein [Nocardia arthritidis]|uniref:ChrR-like cupin domain-containing protein n=1 Tax=Nocardia arthritidis TaxID=228602 RepID=A0A6G9YKP6_9NOCA|nr:hypothetical protein [Nocardia arthritidis]QIS13606.1 hypothetical protein F5544_28785 [Nocardia arthritidis]